MQETSVLNENNAIARKASPGSELENSSESSRRDSDLPPLLGDVSVFDAVVVSLPISTSPVSEIGRKYSKYPQTFPKLLKDLRKEIGGLRHRVDLTRKGLQKVEDAVEKVELKAEQHGKLMDEAHKISKDFEDELRDSVTEAIQARGTITDFLTTIVPYLEDGHRDLSQKVELLRKYRETLDEGKKRARSSSKSFAQMQRKILDLKTMCFDFTKETIDELRSAMENLQEKMTRTAESCNRVNRGFLTLMHATLSRKSPTSAMALEVKEHGKRMKRLRSQNKNVAAKVESIDNFTKFSTVWNLIEDNVTEIDSRLVFLNQVEELFYDRLSYLPGQYAGLLKALELFQAALSSTSSSSGFIGSWLKKS